MSTTTKVFVSAAVGSVAASYAAPYVIPKLPEALRSGGVAKFTNAAFAGATAALTYWGLSKLGVTA